MPVERMLAAVCPQQRPPIVHRAPPGPACSARTVLSTPPHPTACRIRDLNDEINKLIREKSHWERRIVELGGPDYSKIGPRIADSEGKVLGDATGRGAGYRYFGAAKNLPGVKELFEKEAPRQVRWTPAASPSSRVCLALRPVLLRAGLLLLLPCCCCCCSCCCPALLGAQVPAPPGSLAEVAMLPASAAGAVEHDGDVRRRCDGRGGRCIGR